jgi:alkylation response protein AidB-like acyl-CoA dehydrogenase
LANARLPRIDAARHVHRRESAGIDRRPGGELPNDRRHRTTRPRKNSDGVTQRASAPIEWATPEQTEYFESARRFAQSLPADALERDRTEAFSREAWDRCGRFGIQGLPAPAAYEGGGADVLTTMLCLEALGYGCHDSGLVFSINAHMWTSVVPLSAYGTEEQKARWLGGLCSGRLIGCHAITEPEAGSDVFAMKATAARIQGGYVLNGQKVFVTNAPVADLVIVFARTSDSIGPFGISAFLLEVGTRGLSIGKPLEKMGLRTSPMAEVFLQECFAPEESILGNPGQGGVIFQTAMRWERACIMASQVGSMQRVMETCIAYARERKQFGKPIGHFESIADKIANMKIAVDASRSLVRRVGWLMDHGHDGLLEAAVAKAFVSEANVRNNLDAIQIHGGYGYMSEFEVERGLRDAVAGTIYSGTSEIQRRIIARGLGL